MLFEEIVPVKSVNGSCLWHVVKVNESTLLHDTCKKQVLEKLIDITSAIAFFFYILGQYLPLSACLHSQAVCSSN